jgi:hypothetical protein
VFGSFTVFDPRQFEDLALRLELTRLHGRRRRAEQGVV